MGDSCCCSRPLQFLLRCEKEKGGTGRYSQSELGGKNPRAHGKMGCSGSRCATPIDVSLGLVEILTCTFNQSHTIAENLTV